MFALAGLVSLTLGLGSPLTGDIDLPSNGKIAAGTPLGIALLLISLVVYVAILNSLPKGVRPWSVLTRHF